MNLQPAPTLHKKERIIIRKEVIERDGPLCIWCGVSVGSGGTLDHARPRSRGGSNHIDNFILSCAYCNRGRGKRGLDEWAAIRRRQGLPVQEEVLKKAIKRLRREHTYQKTIQHKEEKIALKISQEEEIADARLKGEEAAWKGKEQDENPFFPEPFIGRERALMSAKRDAWNAGHNSVTKAA
jgi:hypothetical protein